MLCATLNETFVGVPSALMQSQQFPVQQSAKEELFLKPQQYRPTTRSPLSDIDTSTNSFLDSIFNFGSLLSKFKELSLL